MKTLCFFLLWCPLVASGQISDSFSDGNFTYNPPWTGDSALFEVNQAGQLHLNASGNDTAYLSTDIEIPAQVEWRFWLRLSFNTSSNNYARVYLTAASSQLDMAPDGIYLQAGGSDDSISLIRQDAGETQKIGSLKSYRTNHSTNTLRFRLIFGNGTWVVMFDSTGGANMQTAGIFQDGGFVPGNTFGIFCRFTTSNAAKIYLDDVYAGPVIIDTASPELVMVQGRSATEIVLYFNESLNGVTALNCGNYLMTGAARKPDSVMVDPETGCRVCLRFIVPLNEGYSDSLKISGVADAAGNIMEDTTVLAGFYRARAFDLLISEVLADPSPSAGLPEGEFIELYNQSGHPIYTGGWTLEIGQSIKSLPEMTLNDNEYLLITRDSGYVAYGTCLLLFSSSTSLPNSGSTIVIKNDDRQVIHCLTYDPLWYGDSFKAEGGWSLEMVDQDNPCGCGKNWKASTHPEGGTPGRANSVRALNPDSEAPELIRAVIVDSARTQVFISETVDSASVCETIKWSIGQPGSIPVSVLPVSPDYRSVVLMADSAFIRGRPYTITFNGRLTDCAANESDTVMAVRTAIPDSIKPGCAMINEVLMDPYPGGERYVELYNRTGKVVDISDMLLVTQWDEAGFPLNGEPLALSPYLLFPGDYLAVTSDPEDVITRYHAPFRETILKMDFFPTMNSDTGCVGVIHRSDGTSVDIMNYSSSMHYPLLRSNEGVSLERLDTERASAERSNWFSAAESVWFGTPGYQNSHQGIRPAGAGTVELQPHIFSPDNDGYQDILTIFVKPVHPGSMANLFIFDSRGRIVREIARNVLAGNEEIFYWDGISITGERVAVGLYILLAEILSPDGTTERLKRTIAVSGRF